MSRHRQNVHAKRKGQLQIADLLNTVHNDPPPGWSYSADRKYWRSPPKTFAFPAYPAETPLGGTP